MFTPAQTHMFELDPPFLLSVSLDPDGHKVSLWTIKSSLSDQVTVSISESQRPQSCPLLNFLNWKRN